MIESKMRKRERDPTNNLFVGLKYHLIHTIYQNTTYNIIKLTNLQTQNLTISEHIFIYKVYCISKILFV